MTCKACRNSFWEEKWWCQIDTVNIFAYDLAQWTAASMAMTLVLGKGQLLLSFPTLLYHSKTSDIFRQICRYANQSSCGFVEGFATGGLLSEEEVERNRHWISMKVWNRPKDTSKAMTTTYLIRSKNLIRWHMNKSNNQSNFTYVMYILLKLCNAKWKFPPTYLDNIGQWIALINGN